MPLMRMLYSTKSMAEIILRNAIKKLPPPLESNKHKGQAGRIGVIGGSKEYTGAPYFAGITALLCGADLVYVFCMRDAACVIKSFCPELIVLPYLDDPEGLNLMLPRLANLHTLVIGPGLGENSDVQTMIVSLIKLIKTNSSKPISKMVLSLVFDADGIGLLCQTNDLLNDYPGQVYLTPNANEIKKLAAVFDIDLSNIHLESYNSRLQELISRINPNAVLIVKGAIDKIVKSDGIWECSVEGSLRRVGGQGDLLSGSLGLFSYWANILIFEHQTLQGKSNDCDIKDQGPVLAAYAACAITRTSGKYAFLKKERSMITSDMISNIGTAWSDCFG